jgi:hypothetical protein
MFSAIVQASNEEDEMCFRLRVWLPLVQLAVAIALTTSKFLRLNRIENPSWIAPDRQICDALNAPAALVRFFLLKFAVRAFTRPSRVDFILETIVYFALVGVLWFFVAVEINARNREKLSALTAKTGIRTAADVVLIAFGAGLTVLGQLVRHQFGGIPDTYSNLIAVPYFIWAIVIVVFYGHDLWATRVTGRGLPDRKG